MSDTHEIELKFTCPSEALDAALAAAPAGEDEEKELTSVYFDTPDLHLQKAGATLRVREAKGRRVQTFKRGEGFSRQEHEAPIDADVPDPNLGPVAALLDGKAAELKPAFSVRVTRRQRVVAWDGAEIELAADQGEVRAAGQTSPVSELELELKSGQPAALFALARQLAQAAPLHLSFDTKSDRGQSLVAGEALHARKKGKVQLAENATTAEAFQAIARQALVQMAANAGVLREAADPEAVHQLRVAARTFRSALSTFRAVVGGVGYEDVKAELRWLAKACDAARNLDVFAEETLAPARTLDHPPHGLAALEAAVAAARDAARVEVAQAVGSERFRLLMIDVAAWVETGPWLAAEPGREPAAAFAARALDKRRRKILKTGKRLERLSDEDRHQVRIQGKKLRYAAEAFASLWPDRKPARFIGKVKDLQEELGALNDLATAETLVESLQLPPDAAFAAGELVGMKVADKSARIHAAAQALAEIKSADRFWRS
ncbi:CHAD domain-containing protein [Phenylobacterium deserti]|uniref:Inorganic triphosphatase n=1 Tax=Phenylobacterium deserti TaxID=1914756 RepID=A0A328AWM5_9CAUL|nr:CHAD domain-containing protein [Phenylobacterium deserti]RAK57258.1 inorganic triphosphatase [Phenylobacterium deserti]